MHIVDFHSWSTYLDLYHLRPVFLALHISGGIIGLPVLALTCILSKTAIPSQPDLINIYISGIINSLSYILLVFAPQWQNPPYPLCFIQSAMILGAPPMTAISILLVVIKMHLTFRDPLNFLTRPGRISERPKLLLFYCIPYIVFVVLFFTSVGIQVSNRDSVSARNGLYCTVYGIPFRRAIVPSISILALLSMVVLEVLILKRYIVSRRRMAISFPLAGARAMSSGIIIRVIIFNLYLGIVVGASVVFIFGCRQAWPYMTQAALPLATFIIFGTQKSVVNVWIGWFKPNTKAPISASDVSILMPARV